ncbi:MAG TPA: hypothetical protein VMK65_11795 [Longimicrobiales bacterium]|nr:hypothetical protein [Longimicrobiales bacterium]
MNTTQSSPLSPVPSAIERLRQHAAKEAARRRRRPRDQYFAALEARYTAYRERAHAAGVAASAPGSLLQAIDAELAALNRQQALRPALEAALKKYPPPAPSDPPRLAAELQGFRDVCGGALATLDNVGRLEAWRTRIVETAEDVGSPSARAAAHVLDIVPLLDRARGLDGILVQLDGLARGVEALAAALEAQLAPASAHAPVYSAPTTSADPPRRAAGPLSRD